MVGTLPKLENGQQTDSADFEMAISKTGFGKFNAILILVTIPSILATQSDLSALAFVFPAAKCDLNLSLEDQGMVNAVMYTGTISSAFLWGSLVDVFGRRKMLMIIHFADFIFTFMTVFTPNVYYLAAAKFFGGFIINGSAMAITPYLSEFHGMKYRSRVPLTLGILYNFGNILLPFIAWFLLPINPNFKIGSFEFHGWNIFLCVCSVPTLLSGILFYFMPETPKYLISKGQNEEALKVFKNIYRINSGQCKDSYPIKKLKDERQIFHKKSSLKEAWKQIAPLFSSLYIYKLILVCSMMGFLMTCINSLRLFLPQIFQTINDYQEDSKSFCEILNIKSTSADVVGNCTINFDNSSVYINSMFVALTCVFGYITVAFVVNITGKKRILVTLEFGSIATAVTIYFAPNSTTGVVFICGYMMFTCICIDVLVTIIVDLFPTYLRASALSMAFMWGRIGSIFGNLLFPVLIQTGCEAQFFTLAAFVSCSAVISLFLPNTDNTALK